MSWSAMRPPKSIQRYKEAYFPARAFFEMVAEKLPDMQDQVNQMEDEEFQTRFGLDAPVSGSKWAALTACIQMEESKESEEDDESEEEESEEEQEEHEEAIPPKKMRTKNLEVAFCS